ncbi:MAG: hypothetical protein ACOH2K_01290 [Burkholderiaceae bacterium]
MNKNLVPKSGNADTSIAEKPAPVVAKAVTTAHVAAPSQTGTATKVTRVSRTPAVKKPAVKTAVKPVAKTLVKPAVATRTIKATAAKIAVPVAKPPTAAKPVAAAKPIAAVKEKAKKAKLVRDSFTMPEDEFAVLGKVKKASLKAGFEVKKSELLRIGVALVDQLSAAQLKIALASLVPLKAGRPKKDK